MKKFKNKLSDFYKWVKGSELVELDYIDVSEDPVRPELDLEFRLGRNRKIYGLEYKGNIEGVVCIALCSEVPKSTRALEKFSSDVKENKIAIAYTIWSRKRGAGRQLLGKIRKHIEKNSENVGPNFASEARKMHIGDVPERSIYGESTIKEAKELIDDGISVVPLPFIPSKKTN